MANRPTGGRYRAAVLYPNRYRVGMSNLGYQTVLRIFLEQPGLDARRVFLHNSGLHFPDGGRDLTDFDFVAISVSYQPDMVHLPRLLDSIKVESGLHGRRPLILGGGVALSINPEPVADLFDIILLGDAEPVLPALLNMLCEAESGREALLTTAAGLTGIYVPTQFRPEKPPGSSFLVPRGPASLPTSIPRSVLTNLDESPAVPAVLSRDTEFGDLYLLEVSRGCGAGCAFCAAGSICGPMRFLGMERFAREAARGLKFRRKLGLVGTAVSFHPRLADMGRLVHEMGGSFSPSSIRAEKVTPEIAVLLAKSGHKTVSLAPEAGSDRLRAAVGKPMSSRLLLEKVDVLAEAGIPNIKLYFMVGLPGEEDSDVMGIVELSRKVRDHLVAAGRMRGRVGMVTVSVNPFVPKPGTPLERTDMAPEGVLLARLGAVKSGLGPVGGVRVQTGSVRMAYLDAMLSLGDRSVLDVLDKLPEKGVSLKRLTRLAPAAEPILFGRQSGVLPWSFIK